MISSIRRRGGPALLLVALLAAGAQATPLHEDTSGEPPGPRHGLRQGLRGEGLLPADLLIPGGGGYLASRRPGAVQARDAAGPGPGGWPGARAAHQHWGLLPVREGDEAEDTPGWLTARFEADRDRPGADDSDDLVIISQSWENDSQSPRDPSQISLREVARALARPAGAQGAGRERGGAGAPDQLSLGIDLVRATLELEVDAELAASIVTYTSGIREFLGPVLSVRRFAVEPAAGPGQAAEAPAALPAAITVSAAELERIKRDHADRGVHSLREFVASFLLDPRVILFLALSVLTIALVSLGVLRWARR